MVGSDIRECTGKTIEEFYQAPGGPMSDWRLWHRRARMACHYPTHIDTLPGIFRRHHLRLKFQVTRVVEIEAELWTRYYEMGS